MAEIIGGQKIITKDRLSTELHNFYTKILPYLSKNTVQTTLDSYELLTVTQDVVSGQNAVVKNKLLSWLEHDIIEFSVKGTTNYILNGRTYKGETYSNMTLSKNDITAIKTLANKIITDNDVEKIMIINNSSNASGFSFAGLKGVEISMSKAYINEAYIRVFLDVETFGDVNFTFDVIASDY